VSDAALSVCLIIVVMSGKLLLHQFVMHSALCTIQTKKRGSELLLVDLISLSCVDTVLSKLGLRHGYNTIIHPLKEYY